MLPAELPRGPPLDVEAVRPRLEQFPVWGSRELQLSVSLWAQTLTSFLKAYYGNTDTPSVFSCASRALDDASCVPIGPSFGMCADGTEAPYLEICREALLVRRKTRRCNMTKYLWAQENTVFVRRSCFDVLLLA